MSSPSRFTLNRESLTRVFFFTVFAFLLYQVFLLARPFLPSFILAFLLTIMFYPLYRRVRRSVRNPNIAALLLTLCVVLSAILPLSLVVLLVIRESGNLLPVVQNVMETLQSGQLPSITNNLPAPLAGLSEQLRQYLSAINVDLKPFVLQNIQALRLHIAAVGGMLAKNAIFMFFKLLILVITLFFTFRDGQRFLSWILNLIPMESGHKEAVAKSAYETFWAVTIGVFLTAAAQGLVATIGYVIGGTRLPLLLGVATGAVSLLGASFVITIPTAIIMMMEDTGRGWFLLIWGATAVGWLDNFLRPMLIGSRARMPFVLVFFSILGGLKMYGLLGLILGPILVASVLTFIRIYKEAYSHD